MCLWNSGYSTKRCSLDQHYSYISQASRPDTQPLLLVYFPVGIEQNQFHGHAAFIYFFLCSDLHKTQQTNMGKMLKKFGMR